jgi:hypothetical protein
VNLPGQINHPGHGRPIQDKTIAVLRAETVNSPATSVRETRIEVPEGSESTNPCRGRFTIAPHSAINRDRVLNSFP